MASWRSEEKIIHSKSHLKMQFKKKTGMPTNLKSNKMHLKQNAEYFRITGVMNQNQMEDIRTPQKIIYTKTQYVKFGFQNCRGKKRGKKGKDDFQVSFVIKKNPMSANFSCPFFMYLMIFICINICN